MPKKIGHWVELVWKKCHVSNRHTTKAEYFFKISIFEFDKICVVMCWSMLSIKNQNFEILLIFVCVSFSRE